MSRDVLDLIDAALDDYATSTDAMRWAPDAPDPTVGPARVDPGPTDGSAYVLPAELWDRAIVDETRRVTPRDISIHTTTAWPPDMTWEATIRVRLSPVFERLGGTLTDWQFEVLSRTFAVPVQMLLSRAVAERRQRLRRMHSEYHRRTRHRRTR